MRRTITILSLFFFISSYALNYKQATTIKGNPINGQDNYILINTKAIHSTVECTFQNNSKVDAKIDIWNSPKQTKPFKTLLLKPDTHTKFSLKFELKPHWWCMIYVPDDEHERKYCAYFSISDATLSTYHAFATWNKTTRAKRVTYSCKVNSPAKFYYTD